MKETHEAYLLAGAGLVKGIYEEAKALPAGDKAWIGIMGSVAIYEVLAPKGQLLSESTDRLIERYPKTTRATIGYTALHLMNWLPEKIDLFHQLSSWSTSDQS